MATRGCLAAASAPTRHLQEAWRPRCGGFGGYACARHGLGLWVEVGRTLTRRQMHWELKLTDRQRWGKRSVDRMYLLYRRR